jgi:hypothetical protein
LNWVRETFEDTKGEAWLGFYEGDPEDEEDKHSGMFLRNAVICGIGMVEHYQEQGVIPQTPIATGSVDLSRQLRLTPSEESGANNTINKLSDTPDTLPALIEIFGWYPPPQPANTLSDGSPRWLLIGDIQNRLLWVASNAINVGTTDVEIYPQADVDVLAPERAYSDSDLQTILGS